MRSKEELENDPWLRDDMSELVKLLEERKIPFVLRPHPLTLMEPRSKDLMGYWISGKDQIIIKDRYSVVRGMVSFGSYEIMRIKGIRGKFKNPERFRTPEELLDALLGTRSK